MKRRYKGLDSLQSILKFPLKFETSHEVEGVEACTRVAGLVSTLADFNSTLRNGELFPSVFMIVDESAVTNLCNRHRMPILGIHFFGEIWHFLPTGIPHSLRLGGLVQFYAVVLLGHTYRHIIGLTPPLSCALMAKNSAHRKEMIRACIAANVLQQRIHRDLERMQAKSDLPDFMREEYLFPAITQLRQYRKLGDEYVKFRLVEHHAGSGEKDYEHRRIYRAEVSRPSELADEQILVKFSLSYSIELHEFCADRGLAPRILAYEELPGGWHAIAMKYLKDAEPVDRPLPPDQKKQLQDLVKAFHEKGLVHGDLHK